MKKISFIIVSILLICAHASAESSVWKVQKGESVIYLGGTIHLLRDSDFPLPKEFEEAYRKSEILVFETDLGKFNDPSIQKELISRAMYSDGSTIDQHLTQKTYSLLQKYCSKNNIPLTALKQFKPSAIAVTIATIELAKLGVGQYGVDMFFYEQAKKDMKIIEALESVEEQIQYIVDMGEGNEDAFITYTIRDMNSIKQHFEDMLEAWSKGDTNRLNHLIISELKTKTPKLYKELMIDRNENWLPVIDTYQKTREIEFILVGVGHLVGPEGIIVALMQKGYKVEKL